MAVTFRRRGGRVVGMQMLAAELRWAFRTLTGRRYNDSASNPTDGELLMNTYTEQQIREAVATYDRDTYLASAEY